MLRTYEAFFLVSIKLSESSTSHIWYIKGGIFCFFNHTANKKEFLFLKKRIWFNRWFSTAYHLIESIKNNTDGMEFEVFGTHPNKDTVYFQICDYHETEPVLESDAYIDFCIDFCKKHNIDIFVPYHYALEISGAINRFQDVGTKVLVSENNKLMQTISHKGKLYDSLIDTDLKDLLPEYKIVETAEQFKEAYDKLIQNGKKVCMKPADGRGGEGFRVIRDSDSTIDELFGHITHKVSFREVHKILAEVDRFEELMVMEYLPDYEYSIDCLAFNGQLLAAVPRKKVAGRVRGLENNPDLIEIANKVNDIYKIPYVYNIQVKYSNGVPKLLEINPRMSGGLHITCLSGINFPYLAIKLLLTGEADVPTPQFDILATHVEKSVVLV